MKYGRVDLHKTNYTPDTEHVIFDNPPADELLEIYRQYCLHHKFESAWPFYREQFEKDPSNEIIGYWDKGKLAAWSMIYIINNNVIEACQFAWNYKRPRARLGIRSLQTECAIYKARGYKWYLLGQDHKYKHEIDGYEIIGPMT